MLIRPALPGDAGAIWSILEPVIRAGETYALDPDISETRALKYWMGFDRKTFVAEEDGVLVGTYYLRANQPGGGNHVCNAGFVTAPHAGGRGVARAMCEHAFAEARALDYRAMQFNFVVASNANAIALWQSLGFQTVGRLPQAFRHPADGLVDALIMHRTL